MLPLYRSYLRAAALCIGGGVALVLLTRRDHAPLDNPAYDAIVRAHTRKMAADSVAYDSARTALASHEIITTRVVSHYQTIRDTLNIRDTVQVKVFVAKADSVVRACTDLVESCAVFRVRAESSLAGLTVDRDLWKGIAESQKPSKWAAVKEWGLRLSIGYVAFKIGQGVR